MIYYIQKGGEGHGKKKGSRRKGYSDELILAAAIVALIKELILLLKAILFDR